MHGTMIIKRSIIVVLLNISLENDLGVKSKHADVQQALL